MGQDDRDIMDAFSFFHKGFSISKVPTWKSTEFFAAPVWVYDQVMIWESLHMNVEPSILSYMSYF